MTGRESEIIDAYSLKRKREDNNSYSIKKNSEESLVYTKQIGSNTFRSFTLHNGDGKAF